MPCSIQKSSHKFVFKKNAHAMDINDVISTQTWVEAFAFIFLNISYVFKDKIAGD